VSDLRRVEEDPEIFLSNPNAATLALLANPVVGDTAFSNQLVC
jgi:hypothetical protein